MKRRIHTQESILRAIRQLAKKLGRAPSVKELKSSTGISATVVFGRFESYTAAVLAAGLTPRTRYYGIHDSVLLEEWGSVVRQLGRLPTKFEYQRRARFSASIYCKRFRMWTVVPAAFLESFGHRADWADVSRIIRKSLNSPPRRAPTFGPAHTAPLPLNLRVDSGQPHVQPGNFADNPVSGSTGILACPGPTRSTFILTRPDCPGNGALPACGPDLLPLPKEFPCRPSFGPPLDFPAMRYEPSNENGVLYLFGALAHSLGYVVEHIQAGFPDCQAVRKTESGKWQRVWIEFEYLSRNFLTARHPTDGCDLIVCWRHNWPDCPLQVVELASAMKALLQRV